jgi:hypothetical protein
MRVTRRLTLSLLAMVLLPGVGHAFIARDAASAAVAWMAARFGGEPAPTRFRAVSARPIRTTDAR